MKRLTTILGYLILTGTLVFHLVLNFPETQITADPNDNAFQYSLIYRTNWIWENYNCPLSLSCLPNLTDHVVTAWAEGYPLPMYYSHIPQILTVGSYQMIIKPVTSILNVPYSLYQYYNLTKYLLLCLFPISVFFALRIIGFSAITSAISAIFASNFSTDGLYGIDPPSYLWRGWGLTSQLYGFIFLPLGLAYTYKLMRDTTDEIYSHVKTPKYTWVKAGIFLALTTSGHLGLGMMGLIMTIPMFFIDVKIRNIIARVKKMAFVYIFVMFTLAYWIIPMLLKTNYHMISFWDPIWKFDSYGWGEAVKQMWSGEIFDWLRPFPLLTIIILIGFFVLLNSSRLYPFAFVFAMTFFLYFGRTTWGGLIDLIPGMKDFHLHRWVVAVQIAGIFLIPSALDFLLSIIWKIVYFIASKFQIAASIISAIAETKNGKERSKLLIKKTEPNNNILSSFLNYKSQPLIGVPLIYSKITFYAISLILISVSVYYTVLQTIKYAEMNNRWIGEANHALNYDIKNFNEVVANLNSKPSARVYAGRPGNWGHDLKLGSSEIYMLLGTQGIDMSQFLPETWSPMSENEQNFDERWTDDYDLLNIKYIVSDKNHDFTSSAQMTKKIGPYEIYEVPTSGWFKIVTSPMFVKATKTTFLNIVQLWHKSYTRKWNMHPLISIEPNPVIPKDAKRVIQMINEADYMEGNQKKNIFADFPFVFPEATVSGKIMSENVHKQSYSARVVVPEKCQSCIIMFKMSYHPNWKVKLDNVEVSKFGVFPFYMGIPASSGEHTVEFYYEPDRLKIFFMLLELGVAGYVVYRSKIINRLLKKLKILK
jgi:hypothetical protein